VWTVDLAHVLASFGLQITFCTVTAGANPGFAREPYYCSQLAADALRVVRLFDAAAAAGIRVQTRQLSWQELRDYVSGEGWPSSIGCVRGCA